MNLKKDYQKFTVRFNKYKEEGNLGTLDKNAERVISTCFKNAQPDYTGKIRFKGNLPLKYLTLIRNYSNNGNGNGQVYTIEHGWVEIIYYNFLIHIYNINSNSGEYSITEIDKD